MYTVLIIDDEEKLRALLARIISLEGFEVVQAGSCKAGLQLLAQAQVQVVLCDVKLPDGSGVELVNTIKEKYPLVEVILLTAYGNIPDGVQAIRNGAFDYITKGDDNSKIIPLLHRAVEKMELARRVQQLEKRLGARHSFDNMVGQSVALQQAVALARKVADSDTTVLLTGETGTGKEVFAQAIHEASRQRRHSFVAVNCAVFSKDLLESELFGHRAGAFTGAVRDQKGLFEEAHLGTLFLDEIGEMPLDLQAKLLRVIETGEFVRIGDTRPTRVQVRLLAATHRTLQQEVEQGHFREDLYYRISVFQIQLPALRERTADIPLLARHFLQLFAAKTNKRVEQMSDAFVEALVLHPWKGNIRELKNVMERSVILAEEPVLSAALLPADMQKETRSADPRRQLSAFELASAEKLHIQKVLNHTHGNKTKAAELLGIALTTLYRKLTEYGIG